MPSHIRSPLARAGSALAVVAAVVVASAPSGAAAPRRGKRPPERLARDAGGVKLSWVAVRDTNLGFKEPPGTQNRFLSASGKTADFGYCHQPWARELWAPFRWEGSVGVPFSERTDGTGDAAFGLELVTNSDNPLTYALQARWKATGVEVTAVGLGATVLATKIYPVATSVDLAIHHDGTEMKFLARAEGASSFDEIAKAFEIHAEALFPVMSVYDLAAPGVVAFDDFRVAVAGANPGTPAGAESLHRALDGAFDALHGLDGIPLNVDAERAMLEGVQANLEAALPELKGRAKGKTRAALRRTVSALRALDKSKPAGKIAVTVREVLTFTNAARLSVGDL